METTQELLELGRQCFENKDYSSAEHYFRKVLKTNLNFADVHHMLGVIYHFEGKFESAIEEFQKALKINPHYTEALLNLAVLYNDLGRYPEAKRLYAQLHKKNEGAKKDIEPVLKGKLSNMHADLGDRYRGLGLYQHAAEEYQKALNLNPTYVDIRTKLGIVLREEGKLEDSLKELRRVLKDNPKYLTAMIQLGITYYAMTKPLDAKKEWELALAQDPKNESAKTYLRLCEK